MDWDIASSIANMAVALAAFIALGMTWRGWKNASKTAQEQALQQSIMSTNYDIYKDILSQVNTIVSKNSKYTTDLNSHIDSTAALLNEWHGLGAFASIATNERKVQLAELWTESSQEIVSEAYELQVNALELTRMLDMSGADFGGHSKVYNALWLIYSDLNKEIVKIMNKWTKLELEDISIEQYDWLKNDTKTVINSANEFGACIDDILKHVYNKLVATPMHKTQKTIDTGEQRRMITLDGLRDNRMENAS